MMAIAWTLSDHARPEPAASTGVPPRRRGLLEWRVLIVSLSLFLYSFGYGGITSFTALYADANGVTPKSIYLTTLALVILSPVRSPAGLAIALVTSACSRPASSSSPSARRAWLSEGRATG